MATEDELIEARREKLRRHRERGVAYPNDFRPDHTCEQVRREFGWLVAAGPGAAADVPVSLAGRIVSNRLMGKAAFFHIQDRSGRLQVLVRQERVGAGTYAEFRTFDVGDIVGVEGAPLMTRTGELSIGATSLRLLVKCLRPLPEKWHGLTDVETRYRQRYLDLIVNADSRKVFQTRSRVIRHIRRFLEERDFIEVETPMMQVIPGGAAARPFITHHNALDLDLYLRIAPELYLKRLVVGGLERVFELNRNFRNEGIDTQHNPEFTMLEFYQAHADYRTLMDLTEEMVVGLVEDLAGGGRTLPYGEVVLDFSPPWRRMTMTEALSEVGGVPAGALSDRDSAARVALDLGVPVEPHMGLGKILAELFDATVEPLLVQPTFITDFPLETSPLARRRDDDPSRVERFELFIAGKEVANAFSELNDPDDQRARFEEQLRARRLGDLEAHAMDEDYLRALEYGLPPTAGEGIGIDRLVMVLANQPSIRDVVLFPLLRPRSEGTP